MKKIIFIIAITLAVSVANAQTSSGQTAKNTVQSSRVNKKAKRTIKNKRSQAKAETLNNRKIYRSKQTGQAATPTGQEATGTNGSHATNPKNAARKNE